MSIVRRSGVYDEKLIHCEIYNPHRHVVVFCRNISMDEYIRRAGISLGPLVAEVEPDGFLHLPHQFYSATFKGSSELAQVLVNFGDNMFKGNKKASRMDLELRDKRKK